MSILIDPTENIILAQATSTLTTPIATTALSPIGVGQTWQVLTSNRSAATTYTNTTGRSIMVSIQVQTAAVLEVDGVVAATSGINDASNHLYTIVPNGSTYNLSTGPNQRWAELRGATLILGPAAPPVSLANVSLLLRGNGANGGTTFTDSSLNAFTVTRFGNAQISTAQSKYGGSSMLFDGTGDYLTIPNNSAIDLIGSPFTIEAWLYPTTTKSDACRIFSTGGGVVGWSATTGIHVNLQLSTLAGNLKFEISNNTATPIAVTTTSTVPVNTWTHIAAVYDGNTNVKLFINGQMESFTIAGPARPSTAPTAAIATIPGELGVVATAFQGYIDDFMLSKGVARYTSSFTPPEAF